jgi:hypothetical protein
MALAAVAPVNCASVRGDAVSDAKTQSRIEDGAFLCSSIVTETFS